MDYHFHTVRSYSFAACPTLSFVFAILSFAWYHKTFHIISIRWPEIELKPSIKFNYSVANGNGYLTGDILKVAVHAILVENYTSV